MRLNEGIHVGFKAVISINALLIKLDFDKAIGIGSNDEVDFSPVDHDDLLDIVDDVGQLTRYKSLETFVLLCGSEITIENLLLV